MRLLVKGKQIIAVAENISFGVFDEPREKWSICDAEGNTLYYILDDGFQLVEGVTLPDDYESGAYFYENGEFVLNEEWEPYVSTEDRIAELEAQNEMLKTCLLEISEIVYA